ncbi:MAG: pre-peptidase C-terminal domain-containing protein [Pseudomonadota bacterium]
MAIFTKKICSLSTEQQTCAVFPATILAITLASVSGLVVAQDVDGEALNGSISLTGGFLPDPYVVEVVPGGETAVEDLGAGCSGFIYGDGPDFELVLDSAKSELGIFVTAGMDTTLVINDPNGNWHCSDDHADAGGENPGVTFKKPPNGSYDIWIGTYAETTPGDGAKLVITESRSSDWASLDLDGTGGAPSSVASNGEIDFGDDLSAWANDGECDDPRFQGEGVADSADDSDLYHDATDCSTLYAAGNVAIAANAATADGAAEGGPARGSLDSSDAVLDNYGYVDTYTFDGEAGATAVLDLRSASFDTYLQVRAPSGELFTNDDYEGSYERSLLALNLTESGEYTVEVSSYGSGATGDYTVEMTSAVVADSTANLNTAGSLSSDDGTYSDGEYHDSFTFEGTPGQTVTIDLTSSEFDTYLILENPNGETEVNDDADDGAGHSQIITQLSELGTYTVHVTSYGAAETGAYDLAVNQSSGGTAAQQSNGGRDSIGLAMGESMSGALEPSDQRSDDGKLEDVYVFSGNAGDTVLVELRSNAFDTYLSMITPSGQAIDNDDFDGRTDTSAIEVTLQETGRYRVLATTYGSDAAGEYELALTPGNSGNTIVEAPINANSSQIYGIFAGMADYPGDGNDLELTDQDALRARDALIQGAGMSSNNAYTLLNEEATNANFRDALGSIGGSIDQDDMLVIFYSGHGSRYERADGPNSTDPDGMDESIELYDGALLDDELGALLDNIQAGTVLLVFDSCFSGGFAKDVVSAPGRMGLFSSEEDVTSQVAFKFQAGGYLAAFFDEAIRGNYADQDQNSELTALELSQYLHDRYRADVKAFGAESYVTTGGPQSSYQHLVVDRGGVGAYNVLFRN